MKRKSRSSLLDAVFVGVITGTLIPLIFMMAYVLGVGLGVMFR